VVDDEFDEPVVEKSISLPLNEVSSINQESLSKDQIDTSNLSSSMPPTTLTKPVIEPAKKMAKTTTAPVSSGRPTSANRQSVTL
jgi:hypothetical protein